MEADRQGVPAQHLLSQRFQPPAQSGPVGFFLQPAEEVVVAHAAAPLVHGSLHREVGRRTHRRKGMALPQESLLHHQLLLADHPLHRGFCLRAGEFRFIQPLAAQLHSLFEAAFQQAHPGHQLCMDRSARLAAGPAVHPCAAAAQPCVPQGVQLLCRVLPGVQLVHHIGQQVQIRHLLRRCIADVIVEVQVGAARRRVMQQLRSSQHPASARGQLLALAEVGSGQRMVQHQLAVGAGGPALFLLLGQGGHLDDLHRRGCEQLPQQLVEPTLFQLLPQRGEQPVGMQQQGRVAGVEPAGGCMDGVQHTVRDAARALKGSELGGVEACHQQLFGDALFEDAVHSIPDSGSEFPCRRLGGPPQYQLQRRLQGAVVEAHINVRPQLLFQQGGFQGRLVVAQQGVQQDLHTQLALPIRERAGVPRQRALCLVRLGLFGVVGDVQPHTGLLVLYRQPGAADTLGHMAQILLIEEGQLLGHVHLTVEGDAAVVRTVMTAVDPDILLIGQRRDGGRVASGDEAVGRVREHRPAQGVLQLGVRRRQCALHLVVDDAAHRAVLVPVPALLLEHAPVHHRQRAEHRVEVDVHQVLEIRLVGRCEGVDRLVREGHGIQEGGHAALEQLQKRRLHRVFLAARQHRVLEDVEHAGIVGGKGAESDAEGLVVVVVLHQQDSRPADVVGQHGQRPVLFGARLALDEGIAGILFHGLAPLRFLDFSLLYHPARQNTMNGL